MKEYIKPQLKVMDSEADELLTESGVVGGDGTGIGYGGIDTGGGKDPSANPTGVWDEGEPSVPSVWDE